MSIKLKLARYYSTLDKLLESNIFCIILFVSVISLFGLFTNTIPETAGLSVVFVGCAFMAMAIQGGK